jgi:hypothetical protein
MSNTYSKTEIFIAIAQAVVYRCLLAGFIFIAPKIIGVLLQINMLESSVPYDNADAIITSKEPSRLSIKSAELPKGGDVIKVDSYAYGAASIGDKICV